ncbi:MAG: sigma-70 family RNA polymerase sigma factor [Acidobacteriota bacterium]|nr:MAG: sigma-70 family RNA polymerase sigma factor [Acidobacteriota bacterium]
MEDKTLAQKSDEELLALWQSEPSKAEACFHAVFERYRERTYRFYLKLTRNEELAKDLNQTLYTELFSSYKNYSGKGRFISWLFQIARNVFYDAVIRPYEGGLVRVEPSAFAQPRDTKDTTSKQPDRILEKTLRLEHFLQCFEQLPSMEKLILLEHYFRGAPVEDLTKRLGLENPSGARKYKVRALRHLQAALDELMEKSKQGGSC